MRILYQNKLEKSQLTATNQTLNDPIENILSNYLELTFIASSNNCSIRAVFDDEYDFNSLGYGYHNMDEINVAFYDIFDVEITNFDITPEDGEDLIYFDLVENVKKIILTISTIADNLYIGNISVGTYLEIPNFLQQPEFLLGINDIVTESAGGQTAGNRRIVLESQNFTFRNVNNSKINEIKQYITEVQRTKCHYIDVYPTNHIKKQPFFGKSTIDSLDLQKERISDFNYNFELSFRESR